MKRRGTPCTKQRAKWHDTEPSPNVPLFTLPFFCSLQVVKLVKRRGTVSDSNMVTASAGDIVAIAGLTAAHVSHTLASPAVEAALPVTTIDPPTISMAFSVNDSPLGGREGTQVRERRGREEVARVMI